MFLGRKDAAHVLHLQTATRSLPGVAARETTGPDAASRNSPRHLNMQLGLSTVCKTRLANAQFSVLKRHTLAQTLPCRPMSLQ